MRLLNAIGLLDVGIDWDDCQLVGSASDRPAHVKTVKAMVDNAFENLWHIGMAPDCQNCRLIQFNNNGRDTGKFTADRGAERWDGFNEISAKVKVISSWYDLARLCKLPVSEQLWDVVEQASPPYHPWSKSLLSMVECQYPRTLVPKPPTSKPQKWALSSSRCQVPVAQMRLKLPTMMTLVATNAKSRSHHPVNVNLVLKRQRHAQHLQWLFPCDRQPRRGHMPFLQILQQVLNVFQRLRGHR